jgi:hypothetical protein
LEQYSHQNPSAKFSLFLNLFQTPEFNTKSPHDLTYKQNPSLPPLNTLSGPTPCVSGLEKESNRRLRRDIATTLATTQLRQQYLLVLLQEVTAPRSKPTTGGGGGSTEAPTKYTNSAASSYKSRSNSFPSARRQVIGTKNS